VQSRVIWIAMHRLGPISCPAFFAAVEMPGCRVFWLPRSLNVARDSRWKPAPPSKQRGEKKSLINPAVRSSVRIMVGIFGHLYDTSFANRNFEWGPARCCHPWRLRLLCPSASSLPPQSDRLSSSSHQPEGSFLGWRVDSTADAESVSSCC
jgi:hypothetical protein